MMHASTEFMRNNNNNNNLARQKNGVVVSRVSERESGFYRAAIFKF